MFISLENEMIHVVLRTCDRHSLQSTRIVNKKECIIRCLNSILKELDTIEDKHLHIIDDNSLKQGKYTPGSNVPIVSIDILDNIKNGILFIPLAWNFYDEIRGRIKQKRNSEWDIFCKYFPKVELKT
jgi:hypothetical protein